MEKKKPISDEEWVNQYNAAILEENGGKAPEGFELKDGVVTKKSISDEEWVKQYNASILEENGGKAPEGFELKDGIVTKETTNNISSRISSVIGKMRDFGKKIENKFNP